MPRRRRDRGLPGLGRDRARGRTARSPWSTSGTARVDPWRTWRACWAALAPGLPLVLRRRDGAALAADRPHAPPGGGGTPAAARVRGGRRPRAAEPAGVVPHPLEVGPSTRTTRRTGARPRADLLADERPDGAAGARPAVPGPAGRGRPAARRLSTSTTWSWRRSARLRSSARGGDRHVGGVAAAPVRGCTRRPGSAGAQPAGQRRAARTHGHVEVACSQRPDRDRLVVADDGPGCRRRSTGSVVFDRFCRGDDARVHESGAPDSGSPSCGPWPNATAGRSGSRREAGEPGSWCAYRRALATRRGNNPACATIGVSTPRQLSGSTNDRAGRDALTAAPTRSTCPRCRGDEGQEPPRAGGSRRPGPAHLGAARWLLRPALPALLRRAHPRRRRHHRLRRRDRGRRPDERPLPQRRADRLRRLASRSRASRSTTPTPRVRARAETRSTDRDPQRRSIRRRPPPMAGACLRRTTWECGCQSRCRCSAFAMRAAASLTWISRLGTSAGKSSKWMLGGVPTAARATRSRRRLATDRPAVGSHLASGRRARRGRGASQASESSCSTLRPYVADVPRGIPQQYRRGSVPRVSLLIAGSIATDHLMSFPGKFADSLVVDQLDKLSVSFLVEDLEVRRGGCAANICFGLGNLGLRRCSSARSARTSRSTAPGSSATTSTATRCTSPRPGTPPASSAPTTPRTAQIASFYAGAMSEAREIELDADRRPRRCPRLRPDRPGRPAGHAAPHRRVPPARLPLRRRPVAAARLRRRRPDPAADRRRRHPLLQRVRSQPDHPEDRLEPPTRSSRASARGS